MLEAAVRWIRRHALADGGIAVSSKQPIAYPEVTGYYIPTLLALGERDLARGFADWLVGMQRPDGSFGGPGMEESFAFDTGQVVRGWVAMLPTLASLTGATAAPTGVGSSSAGPAGSRTSRRRFGRRTSSP